MYVYHIFFIHSPSHGHLDCFHVLTIINNGVYKLHYKQCYKQWNIGVQGAYIFLN